MTVVYDPANPARVRTVEEPNHSSFRIGLFVTSMLLGCLGIFVSLTYAVYGNAPRRQELVTVGRLT